MKLKLSSFVLLMLAAGTFAWGQPNALSSPEKSAGWKLLFDGTSLKGWRGYKTEAPGAGWSATSGALTTAGKAGDLMTVEEFGDFELRLEWKVSEGANSGIIYRVGLGDNATYQTGPEYQVLDNQKAEDNKLANHRAGSLYDLIAPPRDLTKPVGEWNEARVVVRGWKVEHWLNGEKIVETDLGSAEGKALIAASKFKAMPKYATLTRGHIALQDHGQPVSYRNIKIRELK